MNETKSPAELKEFFIFQVMSSKEGPALLEIENKLNEIKIIDFKDLDPLNLDVKLYQDYLDSYNEKQELNNLKTNIMSKELYKIQTISEDLPECIKLKQFYDSLILIVNTQ